MAKDNSDRNDIYGSDGGVQNTALSGFLNNLILERVGRVTMSDTDNTDGDSEDSSFSGDNNSTSISIFSTTSSIPTTTTSSIPSTTTSSIPSTTTSSIPTTTTSDDDGRSGSGRKNRTISVAQDNARANLSPRTLTQSLGLEVGRERGRMRMSRATLRHSRWYSSNSNINSNENNKKNKSSLNFSCSIYEGNDSNHSMPRRRSSLSAALETVVALVTLSSSCDGDDDDDDDDDEVSLSSVHSFATKNIDCNAIVPVPQTISQQPTTITTADIPHRIPQRSQEWYYDNDDDQDEDHSSSRNFNWSYIMNVKNKNKKKTMVQRSSSDDATPSLYVSLSSRSSHHPHPPHPPFSSTMMRRSCSDLEVGGCRWSAMTTRSSSNSNSNSNDDIRKILPSSPPRRPRRDDSDRSIYSSIINDAM
ncbi:hypothetical protein FRACYDRAFT_244497 [Fragilariopsis cylindrus CCMP1102]|uniref:Uncharacterized protein n=1 Tax=Fragilariopsis cylindrus CCMP1102 TaxID=635003 RepID=A0A1E7F1Z6_9STRA|nr:hypothetical protein FRACYDRAFT_244497 [Fragilariopsis cylindrus CCMP1102]|eukprot:OEU12240.1 hypothetical protein FRACYDRAFT_244497 [Fragilariopsis cylindrus CCMP1102]